MGQLIFPSNFFLVRKITMKNNFYLEFFSVIPLLNSLETVKEGLILFCGKNMEKTLQDFL